MSTPNILLILADELRADALGCFGNTIVKTPNLDKLAKRGTVFEQCMVTQPTCTPSRASVLTGCYPSTIRSRMVGCYTPDDPRFLPRVLGESGYRTASIGKIHLVPQGIEQARINDQKANDGKLVHRGVSHTPYRLPSLLRRQESSLGGSPVDYWRCACGVAA